MKRALFLILDKYADWEGAYLSSTLNQREGWTVSTVSLDEVVSSIGGFKTSVDYIIASEPKSYDLLVMVGGYSWSHDNKKILPLIKKTFQNNIPIGAICGAVDFLAKNGFLNNHDHTGNSLDYWNDYENYNPTSRFFEKQAVKDKNLVTANGTAPIEFTNLILELIEFDTHENIEKITYMNRFGFYKFSEKYGNPYSN
ncbi:Uncharacterized protease ydeA [Lysinibacillus sphaericus]|nr:Uncharacterized protease ydeA [Lysinibacillus sphaericus]